MTNRAAMIVSTAVALTGCAAVHAGAQALLSDEDMRFLDGMAGAVMEASRVRTGEQVGGIGPNTSGGTLIRPGGRTCYPAFWIRDYAMSLESGLVTLDEQRHMLLLTAEHQQDEERHLPSGSVVTPGSIPDHISFGGKPIFYPGTLEDYEGQGGERWGILPPLDDAYFFIQMAAAYVRASHDCYAVTVGEENEDVFLSESGDAAILRQEVRGKSLLKRLEEAYAMPPSRPDSGLVHADEDRRGVTFGFVDTITHSGDLLFCSLLKYRASLELADLAGMAGDSEMAGKYRGAAAALREAIRNTFAMDDGFLKASTERSAQRDVWGTAFAVYIGALQSEAEERACQALARTYREGAIAWRGNVRHVPTTGDYSEETAWELSLGPKNRYQNGAYWGTPTGWVAYAIAKVDVDLARELAASFVAELREGDFRKGEDFGSPWECMHPDGDHRQNPVYLTSVTCPLAAFRRFEDSGNTPAGAEYNVSQVR